MAGNGNWLDFSAESLAPTIQELNNFYGIGTHWIEEKRADEPATLSPAEPAKEAIGKLQK